VRCTALFFRHCSQSCCSAESMGQRVPGKQRVTTGFDSVLLSLGAIPTRKCLRVACHGIELLKAADRSAPRALYLAGAAPLASDAPSVLTSICFPACARRHWRALSPRECLARSCVFVGCADGPEWAGSNPSLAHVSVPARHCSHASSVAATGRRVFHRSCYVTPAQTLRTAPPRGAQ
jgi:hypothetical protein